MTAPSTDDLGVRLHAADNVVVAAREIPEGTVVGGVPARRAIPRGHKVAVAGIAEGEPVRKYNQIIGFATVPIAPGDHVHTHNVEFRAFERDYAVGADVTETRFVPEAERATFQGIVRPDGKVATRNYLGILTSVNCSATAAKMIADQFRRPGLLDEFPNVDGVVALTHGTGCGMADDGEGIAVLRRTLAGYAEHPNFAGFLMLGLGCEVNQIRGVSEGWRLDPSRPVATMTIQEQGGTVATVRAGVEALKAMLPQANEVSRQTVPVSELVLGLNCGGSDAYSGITANPALGAAVDILVRHGGTAVLGETPEIYGAEHLLTRRAVSPEIAEKLVERIKWWEEYTAKNNGSMDNNPSPGNKAGGLTTILEKSLGAVAKGGTTNLTGVYKYAERVTAKGFTFMDTPGYDPVSVTGIVAGGATVMCFTTGRGSVLGTKPTPSIKLATNTEMYERMSGDMDVNCGVILSEGESVQAVGERLFQFILDTASGRKTFSEELGFGQEEFVPWQLGAVM
ncbi:altronate dehydratase family protein [Pseudonocardia sp. DSM 110487]|uniref:UxaA family hydrolase n=1 Tax=Pseudonocardia sp. DSM 110487 TaxID=2865833 RepID=UPI001C69DBEB|nr:altronate dehydratase family protein [Pseudonocardia sp. DSM 110487]QYN37168.1 altronate dehydratase family protein [Pseudonocardia sp. DSM 110487]